ncbi:MAG: hypothetical protein KGL39_56820, partial [Patescibacteria group bacterium]|nr:hypothetical protein [Patescibacteria group bacterium]
MATWLRGLGCVVLPLGQACGVPEFNRQPQRGNDAHRLCAGLSGFNRLLGGDWFNSRSSSSTTSKNK